MASPARRALAPIDANRPSPSPMHLKSPRKNISALLPRPGLLASPAKKRALDVEERAVKRSRVEGPSRGLAEGVARSASPDASVDGIDSRPSDTRRVSIERERETRRQTQTRKMAGDLVARLRLAKYKVRTGQAHVPFPQLEARVPRVEVRGPSPSPPPAPRTQNINDGSEKADNGAGTVTDANVADSSTDANKDTESASTDSQRDSDETEKDIRDNAVADPEVDKENDAPQRTEEIPAPPAPSGVLEEDEVVPCSITGGAASGLLRLSQGSP